MGYNPRMDLIDIGVNFHASQLRGAGPALVARAKAAGLWSTAGVHPHAAKEWGPRSLAEFESLWADPLVVAVGECGLDYSNHESKCEAAA